MLDKSDKLLALIFRFATFFRKTLADQLPFTLSYYQSVSARFLKTTLSRQVTGIHSAEIEKWRWDSYARFTCGQAQKPGLSDHREMLP